METGHFHYMSLNITLHSFANNDRRYEFKNKHMKCLLFFFTYVIQFLHTDRKKRLPIKVLQKKRSVKRGVKQKNTIKNQRWKITVQCKWL